MEITFRVYKSKYGARSIIVQCPKCGREGRLVGRDTTFFSKKFYIYHNRRTEKCIIHYGERAWEFLKSIYERVWGIKVDTRIKVPNKMRYDI